MQPIAKVTLQTNQNGESVFVMVPVEQWNEMVEKLTHFERIEELLQISEEMENDPNSWKPWDEVEKEMIEAGLLEASGAEA